MKLGEVEFLKKEINLENYGGIILSSSILVEYFTKMGLNFFCVGQHTAAKARQKGLHVVKVGENLEHLLETMTLTEKQSTLCYPCAEEAEKAPLLALPNCHVVIMYRVHYRQKITKTQHKNLQKAKAYTAFSPKALCTLNHLLAQAGIAKHEKVIGCLSARIAAQAKATGWETMVVPAEQSRCAVVQSLLDYDHGQEKTQ